MPLAEGPLRRDHPRLYFMPCTVYRPSVTMKVRRRNVKCNDSSPLLPPRRHRLFVVATATEFSCNYIFTWNPLFPCTVEIGRRILASRRYVASIKCLARRKKEKKSNVTYVDVGGNELAIPSYFVRSHSSKYFCSRTFCFFLYFFVSRCESWLSFLTWRSWPDKEYAKIMAALILLDCRTLVSSRNAFRLSKTRMCVFRVRSSYNRWSDISMYL